MPDLDKLDPGMNPGYSTGYKPDQVHVNSNPMRLFRFLLPATLSVGLSGCLFDRVIDVKEQACEFDENFDLQFSDTPSILLKNPVLLDRDIVWMTGADPTRTVKNAQGLLMTYEIEEDIAMPDPANDLQIDFEFRRFGDDYRLSKILLDPKLSLIFNPDYLDEETLSMAAGDVCDTGLGFGMTSIEMPMPDEDFDWVPSRPKIMELVGPPHALTASGDGWTYRYRMKGESGEGTARFTIWFDDEGQNPVRFESQYSRYRTTADLESRIVSMNIDH